MWIWIIWAAWTTFSIALLAWHPHCDRHINTLFGRIGVTTHGAQAWCAGAQAWCAGGRIYIHESLLLLLEFDELNAVFAHEAGHLRYEHAAQHVVVAAVCNLGLMIAIGYLVYSPGFGGTILALGAVIGRHMVLQRVARMHEFEADAYAADAVGASNVISALRALGLSATSDRITRLRGMAG